MGKQDLTKNGGAEAAQELLNHINELEKLTQELLKEKTRKDKEEQENKNRIQAERTKQQALEGTKIKEKALIGTKALAKLSELKQDKVFNAATRLFIDHDINGEVMLYRRVSSLPAEALSNEGRKVIHKFVLQRDGQLFFECSEAPRCWAESIMLANQPNNNRRQKLRDPEDFKAIPYRSLKEFNELMQSNNLLGNFDLSIKELCETLKKKRTIPINYSH